MCVCVYIYIHTTGFQRFDNGKLTFNVEPKTPRAIQRDVINIENGTVASSLP